MDQDRGVSSLQAGIGCPVASAWWDHVAVAAAVLGRRRQFGQDDLDLIRELQGRFPALSLRELALTVCPRGSSGCPCVVLGLRERPDWVNGCGSP